MDEFFQMIIDGQSIVLSRKQLLSVFPQLNRIESTESHIADTSVQDSQEITSESQDFQKCHDEQQSEQEDYVEQPLTNANSQKEISPGLQSTVVLKAHHFIMNEGKEMSDSIVEESPKHTMDVVNKDSSWDDALPKENSEPDPGTEGTPTPDVITVPPDTVHNCPVQEGYECPHREIVVRTPEGKEKRYYLTDPVTRSVFIKKLTEACRFFNLKETMEANIPDEFDVSSDESKPEENSDCSQDSYRIPTPNEEFEAQPAYLITKRSVCPFCGGTSMGNKCGKCRRQIPTLLHIISRGKLPGSHIIFKKRIELREGDLRRKKCLRKIRKIEEPVCLTISSDEEDEIHKWNNKINGLNSLKNFSREVRKKEPNITVDTQAPEEAITRGVAGGGMDFNELLDSPDVEKALMQCRTIRIGSYKVVPEDKILVSEYGIKLIVPSPNGEPVTIKILRNEIVKVLIHFGKSMPVLFYYTTNRAGIKVRNILKMPHKVDSVYFDPTSKVEMHKRIILFPDKIADETRLFIKHIYDSQCLLEDLDSQEADDILIRVAPQDNLQLTPKKEVIPAAAITPSNIQTIMVYPPPPSKGGISINTEDYACLGEDQFLNDVIIDFYLKYLVQTSLSEYDQKRTHVFSSFFYKRLTTKSSPNRGGNTYQDDPKLSPAEKRHARVKGWTKSVDLFSKDFIIIPINENSHWFLGIICFPGLTSAVRMSDNTPAQNPSRRKAKEGTVLSGGQAPATIGATTITMVHQPASGPTITVENDDEERDEADAEDDDLEPSTSDEESNKESSEELLDEATHKSSKPTKSIDAGDAIKQPCILIFDSLAGASRSRVCATLREYLEIEYKVRHKGRKRDFSKDTVRGAVPKVPQQTNYTDCGLYVLQYVEAFFQKPITNFRMPIKMLKDWFTAELVSRKRYEIQQLLHRLMEDQNVDISRLHLPNLGLHPDGTSSHNAFDEEAEEEEEFGEEEEVEEDVGEEEEPELDGELEEEEEEEEDEEIENDEDMEVDVPEARLPSEDEEDAEVQKNGKEVASMRSNEKSNSIMLMHNLDPSLPITIEPIGAAGNDSTLAKRKLVPSTTLKEVRNPRIASRQTTPTQESKKIRYDYF